MRGFDREVNQGGESSKRYSCLNIIPKILFYPFPQSVRSSFQRGRASNIHGTMLTVWVWKTLVSSWRNKLKSKLRVFGAR